MSRRQEILDSLDRVEKMPTAVQRAITLLNDPEADMGELARVIEHDPGLTSNILRMANSSYFGGVRTITTVREAVVRLGAQHVFKLVMALGVAPQARKEVRGFGLEPGKLLLHSIAVALAAEELGRQLNLRAPEHTFTAGLLSNLGKIVLGTFLEIDAQPILKLVNEEGIPFEQAERQVLGIDHAEVGAALLKLWGLPAPIVTVVRHHLTPDEYDGVDLSLDLVHVADILAKNCGMGLGLDGMNYLPSARVAERLKLSPEVLERTVAAIMDHVQELNELFLSV
jgi:HD-like signal output (HDOD) protein